MKIIAGYSNIDFTHAVCKILDIEPIIPAYKRFSDGEIAVDISSNDIQGDTCLFIHSLSEPVNDNTMALLLMIDALKRNGADKIIVCFPYLAYTRQKHAASLITSMIHAAGAHYCITIDPHSPIENTSIFIDVLTTTQLFADHIKAIHGLDNLVIVAPDQGGVERCTQVHDALGLKSELIRIDKIRANGVCSIQHIYGQVRGKRCIIIGDIIDTCATLCGAAEALTKHGATEVIAYCTHGILSSDAINHIQQSPITKLVVTNTIAPHSVILNVPKIEVLSLEKMLAEHIQRLASLT